MVQKLNPLPGSEDEYFTKYKADTYKVKLSKPEECKHYFVRTSGTECECQKCHVGFYLAKNYVVKDGHLYFENKLVI